MRNNGEQVLCNMELHRSPVRRRHLLQRLFELDKDVMIYSLMNYGDHTQLDEIAAMLEDAAEGKWFNEFLQACVSANVSYHVGRFFPCSNTECDLALSLLRRLGSTDYVPSVNDINPTWHCFYFLFSVCPF